MDHMLTEAVKTKFAALDPLFDERLRRRWAAVEARLMGRGGIACVAAATGLSRTTIRAGLQELDAKQAADGEPDAGRLRRPGAGRKPLTARDPRLAHELERLVDPVTRGDPMGPLLWTCSSAARLAQQLQTAGHAVSKRTVNRLLHELGLQLTGQPQDAGRRTACRPRCAVQAHQPAGARLSAPATTGSFCGHQENSAWWLLPGGPPQARACRFPSPAIAQRSYQNFVLAIVITILPRLLGEPASEAGTPAVVPDAQAPRARTVGRGDPQFGRLGDPRP